MTDRKLDSLLQHNQITRADLDPSTLARLQSMTAKHGEAWLRCRAPFIRNGIHQKVRATSHKSPSSMTREDHVLLCNRGEKGDLLRVLNEYHAACKGMAGQNESLRLMVKAFGLEIRQALELEYIKIKDLKQFIKSIEDGTMSLHEFLKNLGIKKPGQIIERELRKQGEPN